VTKLIPSLENSRIATVKKWVNKERRGGSRTRRLFQKVLLHRQFHKVSNLGLIGKRILNFRNDQTTIFIYLYLVDGSLERSASARCPIICSTQSFIVTLAATATHTLLSTRMYVQVHHVQVLPEVRLFVPPRLSRLAFKKWHR